MPKKIFKYNKKFNTIVIIACIFLTFSCNQYKKNTYNDYIGGIISSFYDSLEYHPKYSMKKAEELKQYFIRNNIQGENAFLNILKGLAFNAMNQNDSAVIFLNDAITELKVSPVDSLQAIAHYALGQAYMNQSKYEYVLNAFSTALNYYKQQNKHLKAISCINNLAIAYAKIGNYEKSIDLYKEAIDLAEKFDNYHIGFYLNNLSELYLEWNKPDLASTYINEGMKIARNQNDETLSMVIYTQYGRMYLLKNKLDSSEYYYKAALALYNRTTISPNLIKGEVYRYLAEIWLKRNNIEKAIRYFDNSIESYSLENNISGIAESMHASATAFVKNKSYKNAVDRVYQSNKIAENSKMLSLILSNYDLLSNIYEATGDLDSALYYSRKSANLKELVFNENSMNKLLDLKVRYESEKKEIENQNLQSTNKRQLVYFMIITFLTLVILLITINRFSARKKLLSSLMQKNSDIEKANYELENKNEIISAQNDELNKMYKEVYETAISKDKFFVLLSHELLNPVKWLANVVDFLFNKIDTVERKDVKDSLKVIKDSAHLSSALLENLLTWTRIQTNRIDIDIDEFLVKELLLEILALEQTSAESKNINVIIDVDENMSIVSDINMLRIPLRNLLDNSIKFSYPDSEIHINASQNNENCKITISDSGVGIKEQDIEKLFRIDIHHSSYGTNKEKGNGFGLILSKDCLSKIHGSISVESTLGKGSIFTIELPNDFNTVADIKNDSQVKI